MWAWEDGQGERFSRVACCPRGDSWGWGNLVGGQKGGPSPHAAREACETLSHPRSPSQFQHPPLPSRSPGMQETSSVPHQLVLLHGCPLWDGPRPSPSASSPQRPRSTTGQASSIPISSLSPTAVPRSGTGLSHPHPFPLPNGCALSWDGPPPPSSASPSRSHPSPPASSPRRLCPAMGQASSIPTSFLAPTAVPCYETALIHPLQPPLPNGRILL